MTATSPSGHSLDPSKFPALRMGIPGALTGTFTDVAKAGTSCRWANVLGNRLFYGNWPTPATASRRPTQPPSPRSRSTEAFAKSRQSHVFRFPDVAASNSGAG
jgi:hypothetical protein